MMLAVDEKLEQTLSRARAEAYALTESERTAAMQPCESLCVL
jgi:hypothetical protein